MNVKTATLSVWSTLAAMLFAGLAGCGTVDKIVDNKVADMVEEENRKLPRTLERGVELVRLDYDKDRNELALNYTVPDKEGFNANLTKIKEETHKRVKGNDGLSRAMSNKIAIRHNFFGPGESTTGSPFHSFVTPQ